MYSGVWSLWRPSSRPRASPAHCTRRPAAPSSEPPRDWADTTDTPARINRRRTSGSDPCGRTGDALSTGEINGPPSALAALHHAVSEQKHAADESARGYTSIPDPRVNIFKSWCSICVAQTVSAFRISIHETPEFPQFQCVVEKHLALRASPSGMTELASVMSFLQERFSLADDQSRMCRSGGERCRY